MINNRSHYTLPPGYPTLALSPDSRYRDLCVLCVTLYSCILTVYNMLGGDMVYIGSEVHEGNVVHLYVREDGTIIHVI